MKWEEIKGTKYIKMMPEICAGCFWDSKGFDCGDWEYVLLDDGTRIDTSGIVGLEEWALDCDNPIMSYVSVNIWTSNLARDYAVKGLEMAKIFRKLLPREYALYLHIPEIGIWYLPIDDKTSLDDISRKQ